MRETPGKRPIRAAVYCRISQDANGEAAGVARQETECRRIAQINGWTVARVFTDNDRSAYSGVERPEYQAMLEAVRRGEVDRIICWDSDRLARRMVDLVELIDVTTRARVDITTVTMGGLDLSSAGGRMVAHILGSVAENESAHKAERQRAANRQRAAAGLWRSHARRPYGYTAKGELVQAEAEVIREVAQRLLAGDSLRSIVRDLNARGHVTSVGNPWNTQNLRTVLLSPTLGGLSAIALKRSDYSAAEWAGLSDWDRLGIVGPGRWEPVLDTDTWTAVWNHLKDPRRKSNRVGNAPRHLLSGIATCGKCGAPMWARFKRYGREGEQEKTRVYWCKTTGRGHATRVAEPLEDYVTALVLARLDQGGVLEALAVRASTDDSAATRLAAERERVTDRITALGAMFARGSVEPAQFEQLNADLIAQRTEIDQRLADLASGGGALADAAAAPDIATWWATAPLDRRRELVRSLVEVTVRAGVGPRARFDTETVDVEFKA